jgi:hypothetical protein
MKGRGEPLRASPDIKFKVLLLNLEHYSTTFPELVNP